LSIYSIVSFSFFGFGGKKKQGNFFGKAEMESNIYKYHSLAARQALFDFSFQLRFSLVLLIDWINNSG
jgi:hypothetical protein